MKIGYARVSRDDQQLDLQHDALTAAGCERTFSDKMSGAKASRPGLDEALAFVRPGDVLVVWRLDRLGRSMSELLRLTADLEASGVGLESLKEQIDTTSAAGRLVFHVFAAMAEFERNLIRERTYAGLDAARARGRQGGRPGVPPETIAAIQALAGDQSRSPDEICKALKISRSTLYKYCQQGSKS